MATMKGGDKLTKKLAQLAKQAGVSKPTSVRVGFLETATYPDGTPVAMIAAIQNWGAPKVNIPPRPFFSNMIIDKQKEWPKAIAGLLQKHNGDAYKALDEAGAAIAGQLRQSIVDTNSPPLSPITIRRKGFDKPLVDTGHMLNSIDHEVVTG
jgi:hypothetical protein